MLIIIILVQKDELIGLVIKPNALYPKAKKDFTKSFLPSRLMHDRR